MIELAGVSPQIGASIVAGIFATINTAIMLLFAWLNKRDSDREIRAIEEAKKAALPDLRAGRAKPEENGA